MPVVAVMAVASVALQGYSMIKANKAAKASQSLAKDTADYNAQLEETAAQQVELDDSENIRAARRDAEVYTSRQKAAYASSGVLNSGSPLAVEATTAGRMEQQIQQMKSNSNQEATKRRSAAAVGRIYGERQASAIGIENTANMLRGGAGILSTVAGAYSGGAFSGAGSASASGVGAAALTGGAGFKY